MGIRRAGNGDEELLRSVRIRALTDAPERFGSTVERERARTVDDWRRWFAPDATLFFETDAREVVGLVVARRPPDDPDLAQLTSMWVAPSARGIGVGDALVGAMLGFAIDDGASIARVHVYDTNERAIRLYERNGFVRTGLELEPDPLGRVEIELTQPLGEGLAPSGGDQPR